MFRRDSTFRTSRQLKLLLLVLGVMAAILMVSTAVYGEEAKTSPDPALAGTRLLPLGDPSPGLSMDGGLWGVSSAGEASAKKPQSARPNTVIVEFEPGTQTPAMQKAAAQAGAALERAHSSRPGKGISFGVYKSDKYTTDELLARFKNMSGVVAVSPDYVDTVADPPLPNDPYFPAQWALDRQDGSEAHIDARLGWVYTTGSPDVVVAVLDTGVDYTHPDLSLNMWHNPGEINGDGIDNDGNGWVDDYYGADLSSYDSNPIDEHYHGTHVAGILAAVGNNGLGVTGVAWSSRIMAVRVLDQFGDGYQSDIIAGIDYIVDLKVNHGINVVAINASFGGGVENPVLRDAILAAGDAGIVFCAAAGNDGQNMDTYPFYPAAYDCANIISVGASDMNDARAIFDSSHSSNYSATKVDLFAPGADIYSTVPEWARFFPYSQWWTWSFYDDMEHGSGNWSTTGGWAITTEWQPGWLPAGNHSWSDSPYADYPNSVAWTLTSRSMDLSSLDKSGALLRFEASIELEPSLDSLEIRVSGDGGKTWESIDSVSGMGEGYYLDWLVQPDVGLLTSNFKLQFRLVTDSSVRYDGVHIDNVCIAPPLQYARLQGTSMATPHVTGTVALLAAEAPWQSLDERIDAVLDHTEYRAGLSGLCVTGGRLSAGLAVQASAPIEQSDTRILYMGDWSTISNASASGGAYAYADEQGAAVLITFTGNSLTLLGRTAPWYGTADVTVDDVPAGQADFYSSSVGYKKIVYGTGEMSDSGPHTLLMKWTGVSSHPGPTAGTGISLDAVQVWGTLDDPSPDRYEQDDTGLTYMSGPWSSDAAHTFVSVDKPGSSVNIVFTGTYLEFLARTAPWYGKAKVSLDGGPLETIDLYSPGILTGRKLYNTGLLDAGLHWVSVYWTGEKNPSSSGTAISVDAVRMFGSPTAGDNPADPIQWRYQDNDSNNTYLGDWAASGDTGWQASGNDYKSTAQPGAVVMAQFEGTRVKVISKTCPWYGTARITIDPGSLAPIVQDVSLYSSTQVWKVPIYESPVLSEGQHVIAIENTSTAADKMRICLDALDITGYLQEAPRAAAPSIDDANAGYCTYSPPPVPTPPAGVTPAGWLRWDGAGYWPPYNFTYAYTDQKDYQVTFAFSGTFASWGALADGQKGMAQVELWDGAPGSGSLVSTRDVDLYNSSPVWKPVYATGLLADGPHTLVIKCKREKNPSSVWYTIDVDRFDILTSDI